MISKERFLEVLSKGGHSSDSDRETLDHAWDGATQAAALLRVQMPGIGFLSARKRLAAFFSVCRHLDQLVESGKTTDEEGQLGLQILRLSDGAFNKAMTMFEIRHDRFDARGRAEMPESARLYLASMGI